MTTVFLAIPFNRHPSSVAYAKETVNRIKKYRYHTKDGYKVIDPTTGINDLRDIEIMAKYTKDISKADLVLFCDGWQENEKCVDLKRLCDRYHITYSFESIEDNPYDIISNTEAAYTTVGELVKQLSSLPENFIVSIPRYNDNGAPINIGISYDQETVELSTDIRDLRISQDIAYSMVREIPKEVLKNLKYEDYEHGTKFLLNLQFIRNGVVELSIPGICFADVMLEEYSRYTYAPGYGMYYLRNLDIRSNNTTSDFKLSTEPFVEGYENDLEFGGTVCLQDTHLKDIEKYVDDVNNIYIDGVNVKIEYLMTLED